MARLTQSRKDGSVRALPAGITVAAVSTLSIVGPLLGISAAWIALMAGSGLIALTVDAASLRGLGGHLLVEALPGGQRRLRRIAIHEAGHLLVAEENTLQVRRVLVGSLACLRAGLHSNGATEFSMPDSLRMTLEDLRCWSRVLQAGVAAESLIYGGIARGGSDDRALLGRLWGLSGHDITTAHREQRRARREVDRQLRLRRDELESRAEMLVASAPRLLR